MHDVLRQRLLRRIESLPEAQIYQVLDYIEFLESKYAAAGTAEASGLQRFAEGIQDKMRKKAMNPETIREAFQLISAADKVLSGVSNAGRQLLDELAPEGAPPAPGRESPGRGGSSGSGRSREGATDRAGSPRSGRAGAADADFGTSRGPHEPAPVSREEVIREEGLDPGDRGG